MQQEVGVNYAVAVRGKEEMEEVKNVKMRKKTGARRKGKKRRRRQIKEGRG